MEILSLRGWRLLMGMGALLTGLARPAPAQVAIYVDAAGTCDGLTPCFTTIQAGVNNASEDVNLVLVFPGTYAESVNLSLMGSAVAEPGGELSIVNYELFEPLLPGPATAAATSADADPFGVGEARAALRQAAEQAMTTLGGSYQPPPPVPGSVAVAVSLPAVNVFPPAGPAFFHVGTFPPNTMMTGGVTLAGLTIKSADNAGVTLPDVNGSIGLIVTRVDDNAADGAVLKARSEVTLIGVTAHRNGGAGVVADSADDGMTLLNASADDNDTSGMIFNADEQIIIGSVPVSEAGLLGLPLTDFPNAGASRNAQNGLMIASQESIVLINSSFFSALPGLPIEANDNGLTGLLLMADESVTANGVRANRNGVGVDISAADSVILIGISANGNTANQGVKALTTTMGIDGGPFDGQAIFVFGSTGSGNAGAGFDLTAPAGGILLLGSAAVMNGTDGAVLAPLTGSTVSQAQGNLLCSNGDAGLQLATAATVDATGSWWGSATGPMHPGNPGGTGNPVRDGANGGAGTVGFTPFIDTVTLTAPSAVVVSPGADIAFQFSGGGGTVFLGVPDLLLDFVQIFSLVPPDGPFPISTTNGVLIDEDESAASIHAALNQPNGVVRVRLKPTTLGEVTVSLNGPCTLAATVTLPVIRLTPAPVAAASALVALGAALLLTGTRRLNGR